MSPQFPESTASCLQSRKGGAAAPVPRVHCDYTADGAPVPEALDEAMEQEWNAMLDEAKRRTNPSPLYADASLGQTLRALVRERERGAF